MPAASSSPDSGLAARPLDRLHFALATGLGSGLAPVAPGTFGTLPGVALAVFLQATVPAGMALHLSVWGLTLAALLYGCSLSGFVARAFGREDPGAFVLDEVVGFLVAYGVLLAAGGVATPWDFAWCFAAFRLFDITKPPPCRRLEEMHGAPGIMLDDVAAGVWAGAALVILRTLVGP